MTKKKKTGPTADRYIEETLHLIAEKGGSTQVNLREISRRIGCAHTNAYNYFESREDLLWHAFRFALRQYGKAMIADLNGSLSGHTYFRRVIRNMVDWSIRNPGLHRFISSDPIDTKQIPRDILETVIEMKGWIAQVFKVLSRNKVDENGLERLVDILLGYLDGEVFNLINGRYLPGEDVSARVVDNLEILFTLLTAKNHDGLVLAEESISPGVLIFPKLDVQ